MLEDLERRYFIDPMAAPSRASPQHVEEPKRGLAARLRGGGAGKDCLLGALECFLCFECCKQTLFAAHARCAAEKRTADYTVSIAKSTGFHTVSYVSRFHLFRLDT
ncbi:hypothetical protein QCA50_015247 [Cerrena zonata]|uniref:Uncharacterized protein n=1 Tax=Cerrena zonata TaxID=2478898 RepID=A0AAW0FRF7_9APHY